MKILEGRKTYIGLAITLAGIFGLTSYVSDAEITTALNSLFELVGVAIAVYGRYATKAK